MSALRVLIVDDEALARLRVRKLLERAAEIDLVGECNTGAEAVAAIKEHEPQVVFLDIEMQAMTGFDVINQLDGETMPVFIFVTAYDQYAVRAFEAHALDYLLKPFTDARFYVALERARSRIRENRLLSYGDRLLHLLKTYKQPPEEPDAAPPQEDYPQRLVLKTGGRLVFVKADDVDWIGAEGVYVRLHVGKRSHLLRETLSAFADRLDPDKFVRIHRSTVVNIERIKEIEPHFNGGAILKLRDGTQLKLSRGYRDKLKTVFG